MAQLAERSLHITEVHGSNPVIDNFLFIYCLKNGTIPASFCLFSLFIDTISIIQIDKSIDRVLGIWTRGRRMVGADETMEVWRAPLVIPNLSVVVVKWSAYSTFTPTIWVRILVKPTVFFVNLCLKNKQKSVGIVPHFKTFQMNDSVVHLLHQCDQML